ncbi:MAG: CRISPR system precrRNA processing endoribonuclease RAMP protein Cas6 [Gammaproteobacteria bacterium]|nr:CRISPR system precrRNA processing endoribonuclease RAMP protein Cas6 [Gammaproteobacteria bacterium]NNJ83482.1 CRISPR system precrRNA processing endoribonuclease RAMP protein Cas6 [Gammaproteobacteria bacterium]
MPISYRRFRFEFVSDRPIPVPPYKGASFRGLFGHALKSLVCPAPETSRQLPCHRCALADACVYLALFETPATGHAHRPGPNRDPHPFVLTPPVHWERVLPARESFYCEMVLMGEAVLSGDIGPFLPWLALGEDLHVGKATSFGLGRFRFAS